MRKGKSSLLCFGVSLFAAVLIVTWPVALPLEVEAKVVRSGELTQTYLISGTVCEEQYPCITPLSGRISQVLVEPGAMVEEGELLFKLDTTVHEQALADLYKQRFAYASASSALESLAAAYNAQAEKEWLTLEKQLLSLIEASCVRALHEGVMSAVYVKEGETVAETTVLGLVDGNELQIRCNVITAEWNKNTTDRAWIVDGNQQHVPVVLKSQYLSDQTQNLLFAFADEKDQALFQSGETVRLEVVEAAFQSDALIPLAAFDTQNDVWCIRDDKVIRKQAQIGECSRTHAAAGADWANETVILQPDRYALKEGMEVRVKH